MDLTGIENEAEFFPAGTLSDVLKDEIQDITTRWSDVPKSDHPIDRLGRAAEPYVASLRQIRNTSDKARQAELYRDMHHALLSALRVEDIAPHGYAVQRATVQQRKTGRPVKFEITEQARDTVDAYLACGGRKAGAWLFPGRGRDARPLTTRQYARLLNNWLAGIGLEPALFGTHSLRRTKATVIYRRTGNLRAVQLLLGHTKIESTVRYLGVEVDDALTIAEQIEV